MGLTLRNLGFLGSLGRFVKIDPTFSIGTGFNELVASMAMVTTGPGAGGFIVGGAFTSYNGTTQNRLTRLLPPTT